MAIEQVAIGNAGQKLLTPKIATERCGNCKFQRQLGGPFGDTQMCLREPPDVHPIVTGWVVIPPNPGEPGAVWTLKAAAVNNEVRYPPAPDDWWCGEWKPRFVGLGGERIS